MVKVGHTTSQPSRKSNENLHRRPVYVMASSIRIEAAGILLRPSGHGWVVGRRRNYKSGERIGQPRYTYRLARAVPKFIEMAEAKGCEARGVEELLGLLRATISVTTALENPGALVLEKRMAAGLSQRQLVYRSGVSRSALQAIERGRTRSPRADTLLSLLWACEP